MQGIGKDLEKGGEAIQKANPNEAFPPNSMASWRRWIAPMWIPTRSSQTVPQVDQAQRLRPQPVRRMALPGCRPARPGQPGRPLNPDPTSCSTSPAIRAPRSAHPRQLRLRLVPRARPWALEDFRLPRASSAELCRHLLQQLLQERPAADQAAADEVDALFAQCHSPARATA